MANNHTIPALEETLDSESRIFRLREEYWRGTPGTFIPSASIGPSERPGLEGYAENFAMRLDASAPAVQPDDLLAGVALAPIPGDRGEFPLGEYDPHYPPGHIKLLREGFAGIRDRAREKLVEETAPEKRDFLEAVMIAYDAACRYAQRSGDHARTLAQDETNAGRREELEQIAAACDEIAGGPPTSFQAALQTFWFTHMFGGRGSIGRFDQWMYRFYRADIDAGVLTQEEAQELLENLWVKLNYFSGNNDSLRNIALGGQTPEGEDACNELTYMALAATTRLKMPEPKLNLRLFSGSPPELLSAGCRTIGLGLSQPSIFNDEVAVPALVNIGIPIEVARDYCNDGCSELVIGNVGTSGFGVVGMIPVFDETVREAAAGNYDTFDQVMENFKQRLTNFMPEGPKGVRAVTHPFFAASIEDCLEKASPEGIRYTIFSRIPSQLAHVADGLVAIRRYIYEYRSLTWDELISALDDNYEGHELIRQYDDGVTVSHAEVRQRRRRGRSVHQRDRRVLLRRNAPSSPEPTGAGGQADRRLYELRHPWSARHAGLSRRTPTRGEYPQQLLPRAGTRPERSHGRTEVGRQGGYEEGRPRVGPGHDLQSLLPPGSRGYGEVPRAGEDLPGSALHGDPPGERPGP